MKTQIYAAPAVKGLIANESLESADGCLALLIINPSTIKTPTIS